MLDFESFIGSSHILITFPSLTFLSGNHGDVNKCMPDNVVEKHPTMKELCGLEKSTPSAVRKMDQILPPHLAGWWHQMLLPNKTVGLLTLNIFFLEIHTGLIPT